MSVFTEWTRSSSAGNFTRANDAADDDKRLEGVICAATAVFHEGKTWLKTDTLYVHANSVRDVEHEACLRALTEIENSCDRKKTGPLPCVVDVHVT